MYDFSNIFHAFSMKMKIIQAPTFSVFHTVFSIILALDEASALTNHYSSS